MTAKDNPGDERSRPKSHGAECAQGQPLPLPPLAMANAGLINAGALITGLQRLLVLLKMELFSLFNPFIPSETAGIVDHVSFDAFNIGGG